jgi:hypothetical protein
MPYAYQGDHYGRGDYYQGDYYRGDPGLLGFLGTIGKSVLGAVRGIAGGPGGIVAGALAGLVKPRKAPPGTSLATIPDIAPPTFQQPSTYQGQMQIQTGGLVNYMGGGATMGGGGQVPMVQGPDGKLCQLKGYHVNKGRYWTKAGVVEPHSKCVKNRRMNVLNARALRRGLRRAYGFKKIAMRTLHLLSPTKPKRFGGFKKKRRA